MNFKYTICLSVCLLMMAVALPGFSGSSRGNADLCDSDIIGQIQKGKSTKEDVKQLIGEPDKVEGALDQGELWKYSRGVTMPSGSGSAFMSSSKGKHGSGGVSMDKKNCNVYVYFEKNGIVRKVRESKVSGGTGLMN